MAKKKGKKKPKKSASKKAPKKVSQTGSQAFGFHEGTRSEYLAHYVFSSLGTSVPVPHPEDTGLDLHCTLTERDGQRMWPIGYYSIQVKSTEDPWVFSSSRSVRWLFEFPTSVFFCIVTKKSLRIRVYQTSARFSIWGNPNFPDKITLFPGDVSSEGLDWHDEDGTINLGPPILDFILQQALDDAFLNEIAKVLQLWIETDNRNLMRQQVGVQECELPVHDTNCSERRGGRRIRCFAVEATRFTAIKTRMAGLLLGLSNTLWSAGDIRGSLRAELLIRHLGYGNPVSDTAFNFPLFSALNSSFRTNTPVASFYEGIDNLNKDLDRNLEPVYKVAQKQFEREIAENNFASVDD